MIRAIFTCDDDWGIGKNGEQPWPNNPDRDQWFKEITNSGLVIMGRKTWESLPQRPFHNTLTYVISSNDRIPVGYYGRFTSKNISKAVTSIIQERFDPVPEILVIGGGQLVEGLMPIVDEFWLNRISGTYDCDTFLPKDLIQDSFKMYDTGIVNGLTIEKWDKK